MHTEQPPIPNSVMEAFERVLGAEKTQWPELMSPLLALITDQPNPQATAQQLFERVCDGENVTKPGAMVLTAQLVAYAGANPLRYIQEYGAIPFNLVGVAVMALQVCEEKGRPVQVEDGSNVLHLWAEHQRTGVMRMLMRPPAKVVHPDWANATREDGRTPLMVLWDGMLSNYAMPDDIWECSLMLMDYGSDPLKADPQGQNFLDRLDAVRNSMRSEVFDYEDPYRDQVLGRVEAAAQARALDTTTPMADPAARGPRL